MPPGLAQGEGVEAQSFLAQALQHPRRGCQAGILQSGALAGQRLAVQVAAVGSVQCCGAAFDAFEQFQPPVLQQHRLSGAAQGQPRLAALSDSQGEVVGAFAAFGAAHVRAVFQGAEQQEGIEEACGDQIDAQRQERVDVQAAHLDILHAARAERLDRPLAGFGDALGADARVVLVFDLQHVGVELQPVALGIAGADGLIGRVGRRYRPAQAAKVAVQAVVAGLEAGLGIVLVAQIAHPQAGRPGQVEGVGVEAFQIVLASGEETGIQRRGSAEQVHQQPAVAAEVADQRDIARRLPVLRGAVVALGLLQQRPQRLGQREVVVNAGDALHGLAVAHRQSLTVDVLEAAGMAAAVFGDGNLRLVRQPARHRVGPQLLAAELRAGEAVDGVQLGEGIDRVLMGGGDELQQRLGVVGGDLRVGQGRTQRLRVRGQCQLAGGIDAQAFLFQAMPAVAQQVVLVGTFEQGQAAGK